MTKSITDLTEKEQQRNKEAYRKWMDTWEDRIKAQNINPLYAPEDATSWKEFRNDYQAEVKKSFLAGRGPGGAWEPFTYQAFDRAGSNEKEAWRFVEGAYSEEQITETFVEDPSDKKDKGMDFKPSYERQYKGGIKSSFDPTNTLLKKKDPNKNLKTDKIKKSDYKKPKLPKSVRKYAKGSTPITNTAKLAIKGLKKDLKN